MQARRLLYLNFNLKLGGLTKSDSERIVLDILNEHFRPMTTSPAARHNAFTQNSRCRVYLRTGKTNGAPWSAVDIWNSATPLSNIERTSGFVGWLTPDIDGTTCSSAPAVSNASSTSIRVGLVSVPEHGQQLFVWDGREDGRTQLDCQADPNFLKWVTDTLDIGERERRLLSEQDLRVGSREAELTLRAA